MQRVRGFVLHATVSTTLQQQAKGLNPRLHTKETPSFYGSDDFKAKQMAGVGRVVRIWNPQGPSMYPNGCFHKLGVLIYN